MSGNGDRADVLIIGAGAAGGVAAKHLAERGFDVVALEQGGWVSQGDLPGTKPEYELLGFEKWSIHPNVRRRPEDYPVEESDSQAPPIAMFNGVGGGTVLYAAMWVRPLPSDFRTRTLDGVGDDWPLTYEELQPYYEATDVELGASGLGGNPAYPPGAPPPLPPHPLGAGGRRMAEAMNRLGWHWWPGVNSVASQEYGNQKQCARYGVCMSGCPEGAKGSTDVTHWPLALQEGARLVTGARVREVTLDERGRATGAIYIDRDGKEHFQAASIVIVAANGIGTPRLLLMSESSRFPKGLANSSGLVGKRLMLHPAAVVNGVYPEDLQDWLGPAGEKINSMHFYETDTSRGFVRGARWIFLDGNGPLQTMLRFTTGEGLDGDEFWGQAFSGAMKRLAGRQAAWIVLPEDLPEETNRVTLDPVLKDSDGLPAPKVTYTISENTQRLVEWHCQRAMESHYEAGAIKSWVFWRYAPTGHLLGTTRMGDDPATSVLDRWSRTHDVPNLYVLGGSAFVTAFGVNPTSTICALAKRTATYIVDHAREQEVSA